jgi:serine protease AprX
MSKKHRFTQILIALALAAALLVPAGMPVQPPLAKLQPQLAELVAGAPDQQVRVIVHKAGASQQAENLVGNESGQVLKDLPMINAFAAQLPGRVALQLAKSDAVARVSLDAPVVSTGKPVPLETFTIRDDFDLVAYDNNDGSAAWKTPWIEDDSLNVDPIEYAYGFSGDPFNGNVTVMDGYFGELYLDDNPDTGTQPSAARDANLYGAASATLSYSYRSGPGSEQYEDIAVLEISSDGGDTYTTLKTFEDAYTGNYLLNGSHDISAFISEDTRIRFRVSENYGGPDEYFAVDYVQIEYTSSAPTPNTYLDSLDVRSAWDLGYTGAGIGVAVIDSGISQDRDFTSLLKMSFSPTSATVNDVYGHGTHVAGILAGNGSDSGGAYMGIAPDVDLFGLKISDESGMAYESDTVDALQWVFDNKDQYNIRVLNLSIQSTVEQSYHDSALCAAAEILWLNGVVVVAATGNWDGGAVYPLNTAPANDPFVITVGAVDEQGTTKIRDDRPATFTVWGSTQDGFLKPEIYAPGVDIISVLSKDSDWDSTHPERAVLGGQYFRISGTSMATPMVSGAVALLLQAEPNLTPDQVKYRVMNAIEWAGSSPYLNVYNVLTTPTTESANQDIIPHMLLAKMALIAYWANQNGEENIDWAAVDWDAVNWDAVDWDAVNWNAVNWNAVNWNAVNWNAVNWNAVNWNAVNWNAVNWNAVNWNAVNWNAVNWNAVNWNALYWGEE